MRQANVTTATRLRGKEVNARLQENVVFRRQPLLLQAGQQPEKKADG